MRVISGIARGTALKTPQGQLTRPTADRVKEAIFSIIQFRLPGSIVLDLFGGTGQLGIEAISRGADHAIFVDASEKACCLIRENLSRCRFQEQARVLRADYMQYLSNCRESFDIVLLDPPYGEVFLENSIKKISEIDILKSGGIIVAERPADKVLKLDLSGVKLLKEYRYGNTSVSLFEKS